MGLHRGILSAVLLALLVATPGAAGAAGAAPPGSLAGHRWHYRAQVDGAHGKDRITLTALKGFTLTDGMGSGQVKVRVRFAGGTRFAEVWQDVSYISVRTPWTPWLGATNLDRLPGKEIVIGFSTGAHAQLFAAFTYGGGQLIERQAPGGGEWFVNSSVGTGSTGWRCTRRGIQQRSVSPNLGGHFRIVLNRYVFRPRGWVRVRHLTRTVPADAQGNPPAYTNSYPRFACRGLPANVL
jgi:hypothetical protein